MSRSNEDSILILGYGREGQSIHRHILKNQPHAKVGISDRLVVIPIPEAEGRCEVFSGDDYLKGLEYYHTIVRSPGVPLNDALRNRFSDKIFSSGTNLFFESAIESGAKIVGVTGTKGKSTTSSLIAEILATTNHDVRCVGNIGFPMLDALDGATSDTIFVLELSSFQLEDCNYSPHVSVLLNIVPEHLDHHGSYDLYKAAKGNITKFQTNSDTLIYNPSNTSLASIVESTIARQKRFGLEEDNGVDVFCRGEVIMVRNSNEIAPLIRVDELPVRGPGNLQNILAAVCCATIFGISIDKISDAIRKFRPLEHRLEFVGVYRGIKFINDSLSTIPESLINALSGLGNEVDTVIAGGYDRGLDYSALGPALLKTKVRTLILFPTTGEQILKSLASREQKTNVTAHFVTLMDDAVRIAFEVTEPGKICLLSPASSSFNLFKDYKDRGDQFKRAVSKYGERSTFDINACSSGSIS